MTPTPEEMWNNFMALLAEKEPLEKGNPPHQSFLGSVTKYRRIFLEANSEQEARSAE